MAWRVAFDYCLRIINFPLTAAHTLSWAHFWVKKQFCVFHEAFYLSKYWISPAKCSANEKTRKSLTFLLITTYLTGPADVLLF